jgi:hypothetical protein
VAAKKKTSTPEKQALILWALLTRDNAGAFQKELKPETDRADREALEEQGLIRWWKVGQKIWIEVTDKGWAWAGENLSAPLPKSKAGAEVLQAWLSKLQVFLVRRGLVLADVLAPRTSSPVSEVASHDKKQAINGDGSSLRERIRSAYLETTGGRFNTRALLKDIRARLVDVDRTKLDEALQIMQRQDDAVLYPLDNRAEITDADRAAAISFAGEPRHILWIER